MAAVILFIVGSVIFTTGAIIDFLVVLREDARTRGVNESTNLVGK